VPSTTQSEPRLRGRRAECDALDRLIAGARAGTSGALVLRGDAGIGKTALLGYLLAHAAGCRVARAAGVESEMELAYGGLHQLCAPFLDRLDRLPEPQRDALGTAFGLSAGEAPDRFLVGLAVLNLLADAADDQPLLCLIDDAHWLDRVSAQTIAFVARRLLAEQIALVIAVREPGHETEFAGLPALAMGGLSPADAGALLDSVISGPVDRRVRQRIIAESGGNPLALLELPRAWTTAELADVLAQPGVVPLAGRIEQGFLRRLEALPHDTRRLLVTAAAEPLGDAAVLWRAAGLLGLGPDSGAAAEEAGLIEFREDVRFRHPMVRATAYRTASTIERQEVHRALAEATDPATDPDRRAWHRAQTTVSPDESIAAELEQSAGRARARGGLVAASALLERAAKLTPDAAGRARRGLEAAWAKRDAGLLDAALALLADVDAGPRDVLRAAEVGHLRGQIAFDQRRGTDAARLLLVAARQLDPLDGDIARETYLDALTAAIWASGPDAPDAVAIAAAAARAAPPARRPPRAIDMVLDALAIRLTDGYVAAGPALTRALASVRNVQTDAENVGRLLGLGGARVSAVIATEMWDFDAGRALAERQVQLARDSGALVQLQFALNVLASGEILSGNFASATGLIEEARVAAEASGNPPVAYAAILLTAFRGEEHVASRLIANAKDEALSVGEGRIASFADYASAVLNNALGRHDAALESARSVFERDVVGGYQVMAIAELAEAASRTGEDGLLAKALARSSERASVTGTDWAAGIEARLQALQSEGSGADDRYRESIERLGRAGMRVEVARGHLLYGEWLRRDGRRVDARDELRTAYESLAAMGVDAFAKRARRELLATGEKVRKRTVDTAENLTAQEFQIARLARDGLSNPEIGTRLFLSPRTVEWHLRKVFAKLDVHSRKQLRSVVPELGPAYEVARSGHSLESLSG
jgi:DNA-binding CsgD family transcriptional regulator